MAASNHFDTNHDQPRRGNPQRRQMQERIDRVRHWVLGAGIGATALISLLAASHSATTSGAAAIADTGTAGSTAITATTSGSQTPASRQAASRSSFSSGGTGSSLGSTSVSTVSGTPVRSSSS